MGRGLPFEPVHRTILGSLSLLSLVIPDGVHIRDEGQSTTSDLSSTKKVWKGIWSLWIPN